MFVKKLLNFFYFYLTALHQYEIPQNEVNILNPGYKCSNHECPWYKYEYGSDYGYWMDDGKQIKSCKRCMEICDVDPSCGSVQCGPDLSLPDGVTEGFCIWWKKGKCVKATEFIVTDFTATDLVDLIWTCKKHGKL